ncbi:MAG: hypothetical protein AB7P02_19305 [Alphaproteobacteria bacterium]
MVLSHSLFSRLALGAALIGACVVTSPAVKAEPVAIGGTAVILQCPINPACAAQAIGVGAVLWETKQVLEGKKPFSDQSVVAKAGGVVTEPVKKFIKGLRGKR